MSVAESEIQAQIDDLSAEILQQQAVLAELERRRGVARRELNAIRDPVARLPLEIASTIFVHCLPADSPLDASSDVAPMLLLNICKIWAEIVLSTTELWVVFDVDQPKQDLVSLLEVWIKRAGSRPLSISLPNEPPSHAFAVVGQHADRLDSLKMYHNDEDSGRLAAAGPFPALRTLTQDHGDAQYAGYRYSPTLDILRGCPNIVKCTLDGVHYFDGIADVEMLTLSHLRDLCFHSHGSDRMLPYLTLPGLQTLTITCRSIGIHALTQFLERSSPPLQRFNLGDRRAEGSLHQIADCLPVLSTVVDFEFCDPREETHNTVLAALAKSAHLLPNVSTLTLRMLGPPSDPDQWFRNLHQALFARRTQLRVVNILWSHRGSGLTPPRDVAAQLDQLVSEGMELNVGSERDNYNLI